MPNKLSPNLSRLIHYLNDGEYHDGTTIGELLQMTRSAVWKAIHKLIDYGIAIESVKGRGYAMLEPLYLLDATQIKKLLKHNRVNVDVFASLSSSNDYLREQASKSISVCLTERQTAGKGRLQRTWHSPFGQNIYLSYAFPFKKDVSELAGLSLVVSLALTHALKCMGLAENIFVKWPNDIVYKNPKTKQAEKLAGTLIEITAESHGLSQVIIGVGVNVNMMKADTSINQSWTSIKKITGRTIDRNILAAKLIDSLSSYIKQFNEHGFSMFMSEWHEQDLLRGHMISVNNVNREISGKSLGINSQGNLLLQVQGEKIALSAGDASIKK